MAQLTACVHDDLVAAVALVAAPSAACTANVPMLAIHGDTDPIAPFDGRAALAEGDGALPVPDSVAAWATALGCESEPSVTSVATDVARSAFRGCAGGGTDAMLYTVLGGGHA